MNEKKIIAARKMLLEYVAATAKKKGITQDELARRTGMIQSGVNRMLAGKFSPSIDNFMKLCEAAGCYFFVIDKEDKDNDLVKMMKRRWKRKGDEG